jgi:hypothetical protein
MVGWDLLKMVKSPILTATPHTKISLQSEDLRIWGVGEEFLETGFVGVTQRAVPALGLRRA